jgi:hypothetical protein
MRVVWLSFGAVALPAALAAAQLLARTILADVGALPSPQSAVRDSDYRSGKHASPPAGPARHSFISKWSV